MREYSTCDKNNEAKRCTFRIEINTHVFMALDTKIVYAIFFVLSVGNIAVILLILLYRKSKEKKEKRAQFIRRFIVKELKNMPFDDILIGNHQCFKSAKAFEEEYIQFVQHSRDEIIEQKALLFLENTNRLHCHIKKLNARRPHKRVNAAVALSFYRSEDSIVTLERTLLREKHFFVKLHLANALIQIGKASSIMVILESLNLSPEWYRKKIGTLLCNLGSKLYSIVPQIIESKDPYALEFLILFAKHYPSRQLLNFLLEQSHGYNINNALKAVDALSENYHYMLSQERYLQHDKKEIQHKAISSLSSVTTKTNIDRLISLLGQKDTEKHVIQSISEIIWKKPELVDYVVDKFHDAEEYTLKRNLAEVLSNRIEYFVQKTISREKKYIKILLREVLLIGKTSQIISFLNKNRNEAIEAQLIKIIARILYGKKNIYGIDPHTITTFFNQKAPFNVTKQIIKKIASQIDFSYLDLIAKNEDDLINKQKNDILEILRFGQENNAYTTVSSIILRAMLRLEFQTYLKKEVLDKLHLDSHKPTRVRKNQKTEKEGIKFLQFSQGAMIVLFPVVYILRHAFMFGNTNWIELAKDYIIDFNYVLVYYSTSINAIYIILLILSILA